MGAEQAVPTLVLIAVAAVLAPIVAEVLQPWVPIPEVVIQLAFGIVLGPAVLNLAHPNDVVNALSDFGLTFLMFLAGSELDLKRLREGRIRLAIVGCVPLARTGRAARRVARLDRCGARPSGDRVVPDDDRTHHPAPHLPGRGVIGTHFGRIFLSVGRGGSSARSWPWRSSSPPRTRS